MRCKLFSIVVMFLLFLAAASFGTTILSAQGFGGGGAGFGGGGYGGFGGHGASSSSVNSTTYRFNPNDSRNSFDIIEVHGSAVIRLKPEKVRVVLAVFTEADKPEDCHAQNIAAVKKVRDAWRTIGIEDDKVVEDFIAMLPTYEWFFEKRMAKLTNAEEWIEELMGKDKEDREEYKPDFFDLAIMKQTGHRIQSNIHLETDSESNAMKAINVAFKNGVKDIIAFDYWNSETDDTRKEAMSKALEEAKSKAEILLSVFDEKPSVLRVRELTEVVQPSSQYKTFVNILDDEFTKARWSGYHKIKEHAPKQSFYRGVPANADLQAKGLPMEPSIVVTSKVTIQYRPPGSKRVIVQD